MLYQGSVSDYSIQIMPSNWTGPFGYTRLVVLYVALSDGSVRAGTTDPVVFDLFLPMEDYTAIVDLVRNEKPIYWYFDDTSLELSVTTQGEVVGEDLGK